MSPEQEQRIRDLVAAIVHPTTRHLEDIEAILAALDESRVLVEHLRGLYREACSHRDSIDSLRSALVNEIKAMRAAFESNNPQHMVASMNVCGYLNAILALEKPHA